MVTVFIECNLTHFDWVATIEIVHTVARAKLLSDHNLPFLAVYRYLAPIFTVGPIFIVGPRE